MELWSRYLIQAGPYEYVQFRRSLANFCLVFSLFRLLGAATDIGIDLPYKHAS